MKDLLDRIGLGAIFGALLPGAILLSSLGLWVTAEQFRQLLNLFKGHEVLFLVGVGICSYLLGVIVASLSGWGSGKFELLRGLCQIMPLRQRWLSRVGLQLRLMWLPFWLPALRHDRPEVSYEAQSSMWELFERHRMELLEVPWEVLATYRTLVAGRLGAETKPILSAVESVHHRLLFALGVALALLLTAIQAAVWLFVYPWAPHAHWVLVFVGAVALAVSSFGLRWVAGRLWREAFYLTASLTRFRLAPGP